MADSTFICPICGRSSATRVMLLDDVFQHQAQSPVERRRDDAERAFPLVRCDSCHLLRLHPQPTETELSAAYAGAYSPFIRSGVSGRAKGWLEKRSVRKLWQLLSPPRRVLDVGCAGGDLLVALREAGNPNTAGVEPSPVAARKARERGLEVYPGSLEEAHLPDGSVDTVILSHSLEHVRDPMETLREIWRITADGGAVIIWIPNADSVEARILRHRWIGYDAPRHLTIFTTQTLSRALEDSGFRITDVRHEAIGLEWAWALRLFLRNRWPASERVARTLHPLLIVAGTPLAIIGSLARRSGRIRVIALKTPTETPG